MTIGCRTNAIFQEAVTAGIDMEISMLMCEGMSLDDEEIQRTFGGREVVVRELQRLLDLNESGDHFELGAYHNALLHSFLVGFVEAMHEPCEGKMMTFCAGRYVVHQIDASAFETAFFADTDFALPKDVVNDLGGAEKLMLGVDDGVFGVANALVPHEQDLQVRPASRTAAEPIVELTKEREAELRRRHRTAPKQVAGQIESMGVIYQRSETFPYWPAWLIEDDVVLGGEG